MSTSFFPLCLPLSLSGSPVTIVHAVRNESYTKTYNSRVMSSRFRNRGFSDVSSEFRVLLSQSTKLHLMWHHVARRTSGMLSNTRPPQLQRAYIRTTSANISLKGTLFSARVNGYTRDCREPFLTKD